MRQIIPQGRLFPAPLLPAKFTAITSALTAVGYVSVPFNFSVTSPSIGGATTYAVAPASAPLPSGLTLNSTTGLISGTPTTAGSYNVAINATNTAAGVITGSSIIDFTIFPTGSVTRETLAGAVITADGSIATVDDDTDYPNNTSRRLRGYIVPPKTGNYYFWLAANNTAEFWLSNDAESINAIRRAVVSASTGKKDWNFLDTANTRPQMTQWLALPLVAPAAGTLLMRLIIRCNLCLGQTVKVLALKRLLLGDTWLADVWA
ncbi:MAG: putative Ig domain-containing protein [Hyphomicrobium sp.]